MEPQLFTDGIGRITVIGGVVRLDMVTYSPNETDAQGRPRQVFTQRIVMGTDAFLRSSEKILEIVQHLTKAKAPASRNPTAAQPRPCRNRSRVRPRRKPPNPARTNAALHHRPPVSRTQPPKAALPKAFPCRTIALPQIEPQVAASGRGRTP